MTDEKIIQIVEKIVNKKAKLGTVAEKLISSYIPFQYDAEGGSIYIVLSDDVSKIRIYQAYGKSTCVMQIWRPVTFKSSGIPTFCPSGVYSI